MSFYLIKRCCKISLLVLLGFGSAHADVLDEVLKRGELRVAISPFEPWVIEDEDTGFRGFEIDVANKVAEDMGVKAVFKLVPWKDILDTLESGEVDVIIAGMAITPQRALRVDFSQPYSDSGISLATNTEATKDVENLKQLNTSKIQIGTVRGTVSEKFAAEMFDQAKVTTYSTVKELSDALITGELDAYVGSMPIPQFLALENPDKIDLPLAKPLLTYRTGMAVNHGEQALLNYLNAWVIAHEADAWLTARHKYWFNSLEWREKE